MARYRYKATTEKGKRITGILEAGSEADLYEKLRLDQLYMISCAPEKDKEKRLKIKTKDLAEFSRQLGTLLSAGVSLVRAMGIIISDEMMTKKYKEVYQRVLAGVRQGTTLSDAMEDQNQAFPPLIINMYRSAEASGELDKVALRMAVHYDKENRTRTKVKNAMIYPLVLLVLIVAVVIILFTFVIPQFDDLFSQMTELPLLTRGVMAVSDFIVHKWWLLLIVIAFIGLVIYLLLRLPRVRQGLDQFKLRMPVFGKLLKVIYTARFARTLSSLYSAGLPIVTALPIAASTVGNIYIELQFQEVTAQVRRGGSLSDALAGVDGFIKKLAASIMIGEETGKLDSMLDSTADELDYESDMAISRMTTFLEPVMIILMAVIVGVIIISVIMPILGSYEAIEQSGSGY